MSLCKINMGQFSVLRDPIVGNVNLASNHGAIYKDLYGINKVLSLLNERGDPSFLFPNLSSYIINNQLAKFEKNLSVGSISVE